MSTLLFSARHSHLQLGGTVAVLAFALGSAVTHTAPWVAGIAPIIAASGGAVTAEIRLVHQWVHPGDSTEYVQVVCRLSRAIAVTETVTVENVAGETCAVDSGGTPNTVEELSSPQPLRRLSFVDGSGEPSYPKLVGAPTAPTLTDPAADANLVCDLNAESLAVADAGSVTSWTDDSGSGNGVASFTGTATMRAADALFNGHKAVEFDNGTFGDLGTLSINPSTGDFTVIFVTTDGTRLQNGGTDAERLFGQAGGGWRGPNSADSNRWFGNINSRNMVVAGRWSQADGTMRTFGTQGALIDHHEMTPGDFSSAWRLFSGGGKVARVLVFDAGLDEAVIAAYVSFLNDFYQTPALDWYFDPVGGDDGNTGLSSASPWKNVGSNKWQLNLFPCSGDRAIIKGGVTSGAVTTANASDAGPGNCAEYPFVMSGGGVGCGVSWGTGPTVLQADDGDFNAISNHRSIAVVNFSATCPQRDPASASQVAFADLTDGAEAFRIIMNPNGNWEGFDCFHALHRCKAQHYSGLVAPQFDERATGFQYVAVHECGFKEGYYKNSLTDNSVRPSFMFVSNAVNLSITDTWVKWAGWSPNVASIRAPGAGATAPFTGATAAFGGTNTTVSATGITADFTMPVSSGAVAVVKVSSVTAGVSDLIVPVVSSPDADNIVIEGDPFNGTDPSDVSIINSDDLGRGPAGRNGLNHGCYLQYNNVGAQVLARCVFDTPADHAFQARSGGLVEDLVIVDASICGFVAGRYNRMSGIFAQGGARTWAGVDLFAGERVWGLHVNVGGDTVIGFEVDHCILTLGNDADASGDTFAVQFGEETAGSFGGVHHNTVPYHPGAALVATTANFGGDRVSVYRNITQQPDKGWSSTQYIKTWAEASPDPDSVVWGPYNVDHHHSGAGANVYRDAGSGVTAAAWNTASGETPDFKEVEFSDAAGGNLGAYHGSIGGTATAHAFLDAAFAAIGTGSLANYKTGAVLAYLRGCWTPTNLAKSDYGDAYIGAADWDESTEPDSIIPARGDRSRFSSRRR